MKKKRFSKRYKTSMRFTKRTRKQRTRKQRTRKQRTRKQRTRKQRTRKQRTRKQRYIKNLFKYYGGKYNEAEETKIRNKLREIGVTDDAKIESYIQQLGLSAQIFSGDNLEQLLQQFDGIKEKHSGPIPTEDLEEFINYDYFQNLVETDVEEDSED